MRMNWLAATVGLLTLAACNTNVVVNVPKTNVATKGSVNKAAPSPSPSPSASVVPSTAPASAAPASASPMPSLAPTAPIAPVNPFGVPSSIRLPLPASVIAVGGGNLIGQAGGNLIGQAGGNVISTGGGNYAVLQAGAQPPRPLLSVSIRDNMGIYLQQTNMAEMLLQIAGTGKLIPGQPLTLTGAGLTGPETYTYLLEIKADHAVLSIGKGTDAKGTGQMIGISYSSPKKGRMVLRNELLGTQTFLATDFDLEKGVATADAFGIDNLGPIECRWEFTNAVDATTGKSFVIRSVVADSDTQAINAFTAFFLKDGSAAGATGLSGAPTGGKLTLMPNDGLFSSATPDKPYDLYLGADGKDLEGAAASDALKALVPTLADFIDPLPEIPTAQNDPKTDPRYAFPD